MEFDIGMDILFYAHNQSNEELLFERWIHSLSDISFDEYKRKIGYRPQTYEQEKEDDILMNVKNIMGG